MSYHLHHHEQQKIVSSCAESFCVWITRPFHDTRRLEKLKSGGNGTLNTTDTRLGISRNNFHVQPQHNGIKLQLAIERHKV